MENTGSGVNASATEQVATAEVSTASPTKGKRRTRKTEKPITPAEASEILLSALSYCLKANLQTQWYSANGRLFLAIDGLTLQDDRIVPVTVE